ncbi:MAG TPA: DNA mismatch repair endonuclease MutL [Bacilli bacterium]|nr:DNA mismatch repair endonuclease MutL [Bacilli bacterium]
MSKIIVMDNSLANQIAAGEVVERPSSVIKELVENSIDARAKNISVAIENAGRTLIMVEDDGEGMEREDALLSLKRHATSKIHSAFDLFRIKTLGFRGEALPSIASVSKFSLTTSTGAGVGTHILAVEDEMKVEDASLRKGTTIVVEELFYNTPARLKYLKKDYTENASSLEVMQRLALAHPDISFHFAVDGRESFVTTGRGDLLETVMTLYGPFVAKRMLAFNMANNDFSVGGYLGTAELAKSSRYYIITLLNGRNVFMPKVNAAIIDGYHDFIPPSRYPFVILNLKIDPALVDVNVHPSKREVRFSKEDELISDLRQAIPHQLHQANLAYDYQNKDQPLIANPLSEGGHEITEQLELKLSDPGREDDSVPAAAPVFSPKREEIDRQSDNSSVTSMANPASEEPPLKEKENAKPRFSFRALAQINLTYIIAEDDEGGFYLVDQHAANERINYEAFRNQMMKEVVMREPLVPYIIDLSSADALRLSEDKLELLKAVGVEIIPFGSHTYKIVSVPVFKEQYDIQTYVQAMIDQLIHDDHLDLAGLRTHAFATMACKASVRANDRLDLQSMQYLLDRLSRCDNPYACPHGRPTIIHFSRYEIEKMFKRTGV